MAAVTNATPVVEGPVLLHQQDNIFNGLVSDRRGECPARIGRNRPDGRRRFPGETPARQTGREGA